MRRIKANKFLCSRRKLSKHPAIADGLALDFISYPVIKAFSGRGREIGWLTYLLAVVLLLYFIFVRSKMD